MNSEKSLHALCFIRWIIGTCALHTLLMQVMLVTSAATFIASRKILKKTTIIFSQDDFIYNTEEEQEGLENEKHHQRQKHVSSVVVVCPAPTTAKTTNSPLVVHLGFSCLSEAGKVMMRQSCVSTHHLHSLAVCGSRAPQRMHSLGGLACRCRCWCLCPPDSHPPAPSRRAVWVSV